MSHMATTLFQDDPSGVNIHIRGQSAVWGTWFDITMIRPRTVHSLYVTTCQAQNITTLTGHIKEMFSPKVSTDHPVMDHSRGPYASCQ